MDLSGSPASGGESGKFVVVGCGFISDCGLIMIGCGYPVGGGEFTKGGCESTVDCAFMKAVGWEYMDVDCRSVKVGCRFMEVFCESMNVGEGDMGVKCGFMNVGCRSSMGGNCGLERAACPSRAVSSRFAKDPGELVRGECKSMKVSSHKKLYDVSIKVSGGEFMGCEFMKP